MANKPYSAINHSLYITTSDGFSFRLQGEPDADFIAVSFVNDATTASEGAKGDVQFSQRVASLGTIVFTCQWGSPTNDNLNQVFSDQQNGTYLTDIKVVSDRTGTNITIWSGLRPKIVKIPDYTTGITGADRGWSFMVEKLTAGEKVNPNPNPA